MGILVTAADERVKGVRVSDDVLSVNLLDGCTITVPLTWYPCLMTRLQNSGSAERFPALGMASTGRTSMRI